MAYPSMFSLGGWTWYVYLSEEILLVGRERVAPAIIVLLSVELIRLLYMAV